MVMYHSVKLCRAIYDNVWLCNKCINNAHVRLCKVTYHSVGLLCMVMYHSVRLCRAIYDNVWLCNSCITIYNVHVRLCKVMYHYVWLCRSIRGMVVMIRAFQISVSIRYQNCGYMLLFSLLFVSCSFSEIFFQISQVQETGILYFILQCCFLTFIVVFLFII